MKGQQEYGEPDAENPEWTAEEIRTAHTFEEVFPDVVRRGRGPQKAPTKQSISIRLDADILAKFRATGKGWQGRINDVLAAHPPKQRGRRRAKATPKRTKRQKNPVRP
jgi:uncharacterized protein (DUF4415 family)